MRLCQARRRILRPLVPRWFAQPALYVLGRRALRNQPQGANTRALRKYLAGHGLSPMGNKVELILRCKEHMDSVESLSSSSSSPPANNVGKIDTAATNATDVMTRIIDLHDDNDT